MPVKKRNLFTLNLTDKALVTLQNIGYIDGRKCARKGVNLSKLISTLIVKEFFDDSAKKNLLSIRLHELYLELDLMKGREDRLREEIKEQAIKLKQIREKD